MNFGLAQIDNDEKKTTTSYNVPFTLSFWKSIWEQGRDPNQSYDHNLRKIWKK